MNKLHYQINSGGITFEVDMKNGENAPLGPILTVTAQQNGHTLNKIQMFTDPQGLDALADFLKLEAKKFRDMADNDEVVYHPLKTTVTSPYTGGDNDQRP